MSKSALYTGTGDAGMTSLVGGERVRKNSVRLEAYGTIDEFSSALGVIASDKDCVEEVRGQILNVQNELFNIGCYLAKGEQAACMALTPERIGEVEG